MCVCGCVWLCCCLQPCHSRPLFLAQPSQWPLYVCLKTNSSEQVHIVALSIWKSLCVSTVLHSGTEVMSIVCSVRVAQMGVGEGKSVGEWYGPNTVAQVLKQVSFFFSKDWHLKNNILLLDTFVFVLMLCFYKFAENVLTIPRRGWVCFFIRFGEM